MMMCKTECQKNHEIYMCCRECENPCEFLCDDIEVEECPKLYFKDNEKEENEI